MPKTIALLFAAASLITSSALAAPIDWSKVKPVDEPDMVWIVVEHPDGLKAMFAIPESDGGLLWLDCAGKRSLSLTYVDSQLQPNTTYRVHLKSGARTTSVAAKTDNRVELDDLVFLTTAPINNKPFLASLKKGGQLALVIDHETKGRFDAVSLPPHGSKLNRFFKACKL
jgi:hypothetical protein